MDNSYVELQRCKIFEDNKCSNPKCVALFWEIQHLKNKLKNNYNQNLDLELKLTQARQLIDIEIEARREAEEMLASIADLLMSEKSVSNKTKILLKNTTPLSRRTSKSFGGKKSFSANAANETGTTNSLLSDLFPTLSVDDITDIKYNVLEVDSGFDAFRAITRVYVPPYGAGLIEAESIIEPIISSDCRASQNDDVFKPFTSIGAPSAPPLPIETSDSTFLKAFNKAPHKEPHLNATAAAAKEETQIGHTRAYPFMRQHSMLRKAFLNYDICSHCQKRLRFGASGYRCTVCPVRCHSYCYSGLTISCVPQILVSPNAKKRKTGYISDFAPNLAPRIPALIVHCVNEIEARGLNEVGLYRIPASEREYKSLKAQLLRGNRVTNLSKIDVHVLCSCIRDFLRTLREPIIPRNEWKNFANASQNPDDKKSRKQLQVAIKKLPQANRDTLAFLITHLQRVAQFTAVKMPLNNLALIFGPTIVGNSTLEPDDYTVYAELSIQQQVMRSLLNLPTKYWKRFLQIEQPQCNSGRKSKNTAAAAADNNNMEFESNELNDTPRKNNLGTTKLLKMPASESSCNIKRKNSLK